MITQFKIFEELFGHFTGELKKYFRIVTPDEYGLVAPIPMRHELEDN